MLIQTPPPKKKELVAYYNSLIYNCALHLCNPPPLLGRLSVDYFLALAAANSMAQMAGIEIISLLIFITFRESKRICAI